MLDIAAGVTFRITGPRDCWWPGKYGGWQPRVWTSHPDDAASELVRAQELYVDFSNTFKALEVRACARGFVSARLEIAGRFVWLNISKHGTPWVHRV